MIETNFPHPHVDMISNFLDLPYKPFSRVRDEKGDILARLQFGKNEIFHRLDFLPMRAKPENRQVLIDSVKKEVEADNNVMLIGLDFDQWDSNLGGHPVATIFSKEEMERRLIFENGQLRAVQTQRGELLTMNEPIIMVGGYKKSRSGEFIGFDNHDKSRVVRMGGAFRMQVDGVKNEDGKLKLTLTGNFCYNDSHQRVLSLSSEEDKATPRSRGVYELEYRDGQLYLTQLNPMTIDEAVDSHQISNYERKVVESIFEQNREPITKLLRMSLTISPDVHMHQIEGFFALRDSNQIKVAIIDFDGIDNIDTFNYHMDKETLPELNVKEKLLSAQLVGTGFLMSDPESLIVAYRQKQGIERVKADIKGNSLLPDYVQQSLLSHLKSTGDVFERDLTGPVRLGRLFKAMKVDFQETNYPWLKTWNIGKDRLLFVDVDGYSLAYWLKDDQPIDTTSLRNLIPELSELTKTQIVNAHLGYLREGD